jgi:hypothetical protein
LLMDDIDTLAFYRVGNGRLSHATISPTMW